MTVLWLLLALAWGGPADDPTARFRGEWSIVLDAEALAQRDLFLLALRDPLPTPEELEAAAPSDEDLLLVAMVLEARSRDPEDPRLDKTREMLEGLPEAVLTIGRRRMVLRGGGDKTVSRYAVTSLEEDVLTVVVKEGRDVHPATLRLDGDLLVRTDPPADASLTPEVATFRRLSAPVAD